MTDWLPAGLTDWIEQNSTLLYWLGAGSVVMFIATLVALPFVIARLPPDYFSAKNPTPPKWALGHPSRRVAVRVIRNTLGVLLMLLGVVMLVTPGQALLTMLIALTLLDFPGRRRLERRLASNRRVLGTMNWMRSKLHRPPLEHPRVASG